MVAFRASVSISISDSISRARSRTGQRRTACMYQTDAEMLENGGLLYPKFSDDKRNSLDKQRKRHTVAPEGDDYMVVKVSMCSLNRSN